MGERSRLRQVSARPQLPPPPSLGAWLSAERCLELPAGFIRAEPVLLRNLRVDPRRRSALRNIARMSYREVATAVYRRGLTLVPIPAQLELTLPVSAQLKIALSPTQPNEPVDVARRCSS